MLSQPGFWYGMALVLTGACLLGVLAVMVWRRG